MLSTDTPLPALSRVGEVRAYRAPDGSGTFGGGGTVFLEARYADLIERDGYLLALARLGQRRPQAQAIYFFLHELYHARDTSPYGPGTEDDANRFAADRFRPFVRELGFTRLSVFVLWRALPDWYRRP